MGYGADRESGKGGTMANVIDDVLPVRNVFREDVVTNGDGREETLLNAPERKEDMFVVPKTFE